MWQNRHCLLYFLKIIIEKRLEAQNVMAIKILMRQVHLCNQDKEGWKL